MPRNGSHREVLTHSSDGADEYFTILHSRASKEHNLQLETRYNCVLCEHNTFDDDNDHVEDQFGRQQ